MIDINNKYVIYNYLRFLFDWKNEIKKEFHKMRMKMSGNWLARNLE